LSVVLFYLIDFLLVVVVPFDWAVSVVELFAGEWGRRGSKARRLQASHHRSNAVSVSFARSVQFWPLPLSFPVFRFFAARRRETLARRRTDGQTDGRYVSGECRMRHSLSRKGINNGYNATRRTVARKNETAAATMAGWPRYSTVQY